MASVGGVEAPELLKPRARALRSAPPSAAGAARESGAFRFVFN
eukprot:CAMPEP_0117487842 /NCGR_PEP_ID=MMETSP0784-20121206/16204_1 /TAXON_ID=39447 /ORGANISM="" /LENGTH=42 /DNA_ID= /DNA_START= /DNA_END= /DNA_ORIENTATION=